MPELELHCPRCKSEVLQQKQSSIRGIMKNLIYQAVLPVLFLGLFFAQASAQEAIETEPPFQQIEVKFKSHDDHAMLGKLVLPQSADPRALVIYVQTAEGATVDMKRPLGGTKTFNYYDLYRDTLTKKGIGFFSYEGRGIGMGDEPPRYEKIEWKAFNTSTLDNKVEDILSAIKAVRKQAECKKTPILLMGASEGTLLAAEAASRAPDSVQGLVLYAILAENLRETFKYIMSDGAFLAYRKYFDTDKDGVITEEEFEKDPHEYRASVLRNSPFFIFDKNRDGQFTVDEMSALTKLYLDAVDNDNFAVLQAWSKSSAGVSVPTQWFKDHFEHEVIWTFLSKLDIPVGCFHGAMDNNTPIAAVRTLEEKAKEAKKTKMKFHYFDDLDHSLNITEFPQCGATGRAQGDI